MANTQYNLYLTQNSAHERVGGLDAHYVFACGEVGE